MSKKIVKSIVMVKVQCAGARLIVSPGYVMHESEEGGNSGVVGLEATLGIEGVNLFLDTENVPEL